MTMTGCSAQPKCLQHAPFPELERINIVCQVGSKLRVTLSISEGPVVKLPEEGRLNVDYVFPPSQDKRQF